MTDEDARVAFVTRLEALAAAYGSPVHIKYENRDTFRAEDVDLYIDFQVRPFDSYQADISNRPRHRTMGLVAIAVYAKEGTGVKAANDLLDYFAVGMQNFNYYPIRTYMLGWAKPVTAKGWWGVARLMPYDFDRQY